MCWRAEAGDKDDDRLTVCRTLLSSMYRPTEVHRTPSSVSQSQQLTDKLRAPLLRHFGITEFTRLHAAIRGLLLTSRGGDVARQRRLDLVLASNDDAPVYFSLFFQLVQLEVIVAQDD